MSSTNGAVRTDTQFSIFLVNKPGVLAQVCQRLADAKINLVALSMMDSTEHGVLRLVAEKPEEARAALANLEVPTTETQVLTATLPHRPGGLADVVERLSSAHVSVNYAYCTAGSPGGKTLGIFRVSDLKKAMKVLATERPRQRRAPRATIRAAGRTRK